MVLSFKRTRDSWGLRLARSGLLPAKSVLLSRRDIRVKMTLNKRQTKTDQRAAKSYWRVVAKNDNAS